MGAITSVAADLEDSGAAATRVNFFNNKFYSVGLARVELVHPEPVLALLAINVIFSSMGVSCGCGLPAAYHLRSHQSVDHGFRSLKFEPEAPSKKCSFDSSKPKSTSRPKMLRLPSLWARAMTRCFPMRA